MFLCRAAELHEKAGLPARDNVLAQGGLFFARTYWPAKAATSSLILIPAGENFH